MERLHGRIIVPLPPPVPHIFTYETRVFFARQKRLVLLITATDDVCLIVIRPSCFPLFGLEFNCDVYA